MKVSDWEGGGLKIKSNTKCKKDIARYQKCPGSAKGFSGKMGKKKSLGTSNYHQSHIWSLTRKEAEREWQIVCKKEGVSIIIKQKITVRSFGERGMRGRSN